MIVYGKWRIYHDPLVVPVEGLDWAFVHDDFDGAPDANDNRCGRAASPDECFATIREMDDDHS